MFSNQMKTFEIKVHFFKYTSFAIMYII